MGHLPFAVGVPVLEQLYTWYLQSFIFKFAQTKYIDLAGTLGAFSVLFITLSLITVEIHCEKLQIIWKSTYNSGCQSMNTDMHIVHLECKWKNAALPISSKECKKKEHDWGI